MARTRPAPRAQPVAGAPAADTGRFERLYGTLSPAVLGYLRANGCPDPESSVDEVFLRVFRGLATFEGGDDRLRSWVFAIAHNLVVDERRRSSRRVATQPLHERLHDVVGGDVEQDAAARAATGRVLQLLELLAPDQRDVLLLRVVAELKLEEVAQATGRSLEAVKSLQHRALASLRRRFEEISGEPVSIASGRRLRS